MIFARECYLCLSFIIFKNKKRNGGIFKVFLITFKVSRGFFNYVLGMRLIFRNIKKKCAKRCLFSTTFRKCYFFLFLVICFYSSHDLHEYFNNTSSNQHCPNTWMSTSLVKRSEAATGGVKKRCSEEFRKILRKTPVPESLF